MRILGIDPGTATTGFGVLEVTAAGRYHLIEYGLVSTSKDLPHGQRLHHIYEGISSVISAHSPEVVSIERLFFATNALTAIAVGQAIGVIKLAVHHHGLPVFDYAPMQVKLLVGGNGKADKKTMNIKIKRLLKIRGFKVKEIRDGQLQQPKGNKTHFDNAADAIALAVCHARKTCKVGPLSLQSPGAGK